ncbi:MAG: phage tail tape measure protein [Pseudomonadota bacterium]
MTDLEGDLGRLSQTLDGLEGSISGTEAISTAFRTEMEDVTATMRVASRDATTLSRSFGTSLKGAMDDLILDGARLSDVLSNVGRSVTRTVLGSAVKPVSDALSGGVNSFISNLFADGAAFSSGRVQAFANGGIVSGPTVFPMRGGTGLMGEAGPEAIVPLARGSDGRLGIRSAGGGGAVNVTMNISTPDAASFARSRTQVAAQLSRALGQGRRNQ